MSKRVKRVCGWTGVAISVLLAGIWAYWGAYENFHEGWYAETLAENLMMFLFQYLIFTLIFILLALTAIRWKKAGLIVHILVGVFCIWFFSKAAFSVLGLLIIIPFIIIALLYYFGEPEPKKWAYVAIILVPLIIILGISIPQGIKVSQRIDSNDLGLQEIEGNGVTLAWAPRGPGWPDAGVSWYEAQQICSHLSEDGSVVMEEAQNIWRLPTVDEAVRSMMLHGENSEGVWSESEKIAYYNKTPDKESPLWDVHSKVIYYWTQDTSDSNGEQAYIIVYHGGIYDKDKSGAQNYLSFRAVKDIND